MRVTWFNGALAAGPIALDPQDRGLLLGDGIFETVLALGGKAQWLERHLARMQAAALELRLPFDRELILSGVSAVMKQAGAAPASLRITLTRGQAAAALAADCIAPSLLIVATALEAGLMHQPMTLMTSTIRRNEHSPSSRMKALSYIDSIIAAREAKLHADDALMLNSAGRVACSTIANVFFLKGKELLTPEIDEGILPGIMRGRVLEIAGRMGYDIRETQLSSEEARSADAMFLTNSLRLIRPVTHLDGNAFRNPGLAELIDAMKPHLLEGSDP